MIVVVVAPAQWVAHCFLKAKVEPAADCVKFLLNPSSFGIRLKDLVLRAECVPRFLDIEESLARARVTNTKTRVRKLDAIVVSASVLQGKRLI
jgi:hypothetical protein